MANSQDRIRDAWATLGVAFAFNASQVTHADPERTLLQTIGEFQEHRKMLSLALGWLRDYGDFVHVERLKALATDFSASHLAWLGGLACHQFEGGDMRWRTVIQLVEGRLGKPLPHFSTSRLDELQAQRLGADPHFKRFGLTLPSAEPAAEKKMRPVAAGVKANLWLRMRAVFGTNWRADMATVLVLKLAQNPYQAEKILGCSREAAYRNWKSLKDAEIENLFKDLAA